MIKFPENSLVIEFMEFKLGKKRLKILEKVLRTLGNFRSKEDLIISNEEYIPITSDIIYEIIDLDGTSFKFYNYGLDNDSNSIRRYKRNFNIFMKRKSSPIQYTYEFNILKHSDVGEIVNLLAINIKIQEDRNLTIEIVNSHKIKIILSEQNKKYLMVLENRNEELYISILQNLENYIKRLKTEEKLNIEALLTIFRCAKNLVECQVYDKEDLLAKVGFNNGKVTNYKINELDKRISVTIDDKIIRNVDRKGMATFEETLTGESEKYQQEYKRLLKRL